MTQNRFKNGVADFNLDFLNAGEQPRRISRYDRLPPSPKSDGHLYQQYSHPRDNLEACFLIQDPHRVPVIEDQEMVSAAERSSRMSTGRSDYN